MVKRRELKGVANSLIHSFVSRNNDVSGYWGVGKLYLLAKKNKSNHVLIDLLEGQVSPSSDEFGDLFNRYQPYFQKFIDQKDCLGWVSSAAKVTSVQLFITFNSVPDDKLEWWVRNYVGDNFECEVKIKTDLDKVYSSRVYGRCNPHDPCKESRRAL